MSAASSSSAVVHRRALALPLARCPTCKEKVRMYISTTEKHDGWVFYKCQKHGVTCDFWRWELEYVEHLVDKQYLTGDATVDAIGAAEERREELLKAQELFYMNGAVSNVKKVLKKNDQAVDGTANLMTRQQLAALMMLGRELLMVTKMLVGVLVVLGIAALVVVMMKK
ncbi:hypothetical protein VPH35_010760 [Triticum aestivum]